MAFRYIAVASVLHDEAARLSAIAPYERGLKEQNAIELKRADYIELREKGNEALFFFVLSGGTEAEILNLYEPSNGPLWLIAHPYHNSLPAALEALARVKMDGGDGRIFFIEGSETRNFTHIVRAARAAEAVAKLKKARIGAVGAPSDWLVASSPAPELVEKTWGSSIISISMKELADRLIPGDDQGPEFQFFRNATAIMEPKQKDLRSAVAVYRALRAIVNEYRLDAVALRCFDLVLKKQTTGCFALSRLDDEGVIAACEGDLTAALGLLLARYLGAPSAWMANPSRIDALKGHVLLAHCTIPGRLLSSYQIRSHFESGIGVAISGDIEADELTLARIGGKNLEGLWLAEGRVSARPREEGLCRTQLEVEIQAAQAAELLLKPLGNHLVLVPGRWASDFLEAHALLRRV